MDGKVSAVLEVQLGPPSALPSGAPEASRVAGSRNRRRRHRGPGRQARDAARRDAWRRRQLENQLPLQQRLPRSLAKLASQTNCDYIHDYNF